MRRKCLFPMLVVLAIVAVTGAAHAQVVAVDDAAKLTVSGTLLADPGNCAVACVRKGDVCTTSDGKSGDCVQSKGVCACAPHNICHLDRRSGSYAPVRVSGTSISTHMQHGDCLIDDGRPCTVDRCDPIAGCVSTPEDGFCEDGSACTADSCDLVNGCVSSPINCDDANVCTVDTCDAGLGCVYTPSATATCDDDGNPCTDDSCDPATGECVHPTKPDGETCNDDLSGTVDEFCLAGVCGNGRPPSCPDNGDNLCLTTYFDPDVNACVDYQIECPTPANDCYENVCFSTVGECKLKLKLEHQDLGDPCQITNGCEVNADCADNDACTEDVCVLDGVMLCEYLNRNCDDNNACTDDSCEPAVGCRNLLRNPLLCADNVACTLETCDPTFGCGSQPDNSRCDDGLACSIDECAPTGCVHTPDPSFCGNDVCDFNCGEHAGNCPGDCIGENSCQGPDACLGTTGQIGDNSCNGFYACRAVSGRVGDGSCVGIDACKFHLGNVGEGSCNGDRACGVSALGSSSGDVGDNSCNASNACCDLGSDITDGGCNSPCACASAACCP